uniref:Uncharacterized protein n=1 Tax=Oryza sativa subsp. japonica TaxID=39947 RepID=Q6ZFB4_ORYSJ|nr:hypothetical protein [Oryza sativa Japonica Group]
MKSGKGARRSENIFCETTMKSTISDYYHINSINIAHGGHTVVMLFCSPTAAHCRSARISAPLHCHAGQPPAGLPY